MAATEIQMAVALYRRPTRPYMTKKRVSPLQIVNGQAANVCAK
jgi:hypothetical protein